MTPTKQYPAPDPARIRRIVERLYLETMILPPVIIERHREASRRKWMEQRRNGAFSLNHKETA